MKKKIIAISFYEQKIMFQEIYLLCDALFDLFAEPLTRGMLTKRAEFEAEMPEFMSYIQRALKAGTSLKILREVVASFTDVDTSKPKGGEISFKDIHEHLLNKLGRFQ